MNTAITWLETGVFQTKERKSFLTKELIKDRAHPEFTKHIQDCLDECKNDLEQLEEALKILNGAFRPKAIKP